MINSRVASVVSILACWFGWYLGHFHRIADSVSVTTVQSAFKVLQDHGQEFSKGDLFCTATECTVFVYGKDFADMLEFQCKARTCVRRKSPAESAAVCASENTSGSKQ